MVDLELWIKRILQEIASQGHSREEMGIHFPTKVFQLSVMFDLITWIITEGTQSLINLQIKRKLVVRKCDKF